MILQKCIFPHFFTFDFHENTVAMQKMLRKGLYAQYILLLYIYKNIWKTISKYIETI